jgi:hypothetical protein
VAEPVWFDWSANAPFDHGTQLLQAMQRAHGAIKDGWQAACPEEFAKHRRGEHKQIMASYRVLYEA